jgi:ribonuclease G
MNRILVHCEKERTNIALLEEGRLVGYFVESTSEQSERAGSIYLGRVENVLPGMQAAFIDIGQEKNAFLYIDDLLPAHTDKQPEPKPQITDLLSPDQSLLVQVAKEAVGTKGARVTTHFSLPGRSLVYLPRADYVAISRKIEDHRERERLKTELEALRRKGEGAILRTVSAQERSDSLAQELIALRERWEDVLALAETKEAPSLLLSDLQMIPRMIRDLFTQDVEAIVVDSRVKSEEIRGLLADMSPGMEKRVTFYSDRVPLFVRYGVDEDLLKACKKKVWLKSGAYLVIEQTEALTVIDVNTGKYTGSVDLEQTVFETNQEAARELARIIRLRDLSGIILVDFIDMETDEHRKAIEDELEVQFKRDRTKTLIVGWTRLGLLELTRKKVREPLDRVLFVECSQCQGRGIVFDPQWKERI